MCVRPSRMRKAACSRTQAHTSTLASKGSFQQLLDGTVDPVVGAYGRTASRGRRGGDPPLLTDSSVLLLPSSSPIVLRPLVLLLSSSSSVVLSGHWCSCSPPLTDCSPAVGGLLPSSSPVVLRPPVLLLPSSPVTCHHDT
jgi:hypothetical protein